MTKRQWAIIGGAIIIGLAFLFKNYLANSAQSKAPLKPKAGKLVAYHDLQADSVAIRIPIDGPVQALNKIEIYSEVTGIVKSNARRFEEGQSYRKGEVLLAMDNSEAESAYRSARSNYFSLVSQVLLDIKLDFPDRFDTYYQYLQDLSKNQSLIDPPSEKNAQLKLFLSGRNLYSSFQNAEAARIRLSKFEISAPFNGVVTEAMVESGQLVRAGQILGEFIGKGRYEMISSVSPEEARMIEIGDSVRLFSNDNRRTYRGVVYRKNEKVDPNTQGLNIYISLEAEDLNDGEYLRAELRGKSIANAIELDRKLLLDEKSLFTIEDSTLVVQEVKILHRDPERVIIEAPEKAMRVPLKKVPGAYPGMKVRLTKATKQ